MDRGKLIPPKTFIPFVRSEIEQSIPDRFERQVAAHPDSVAIRIRGHAWSYAQLNATANRISRSIVEHRGAGSEPVALLLDQGAPLVASILGALKANKSYVPLDPTLPAARIRRMLEDSQAPLLATDSANRTLAGTLAGGACQVLFVDERPSQTPVDDLRLPVGPDALAYIFYTSGSTGQPKGVSDTHRNVLHNILRYTNSLYVSPGDRLTLLQSCSFSGSVSSLFCALLNGACSCPFDPRVQPPDELAAYLLREEISIYHSVPAIFRSFLQERRMFPSVRVVRLEGDQAARIDVELFRGHFGPDCVLVNGLGATETGIIRQYFMSHHSPLLDGRVPIGYPVEDMEILLLDDAGRPVPAGSVGEIAVRSEFLSTGYWRQQDLTRRAFLPDPRGGMRRTYRTGDLGRMDADGCLEHLGRNDFRVKIRGYTVEVAEVESALLSHPAVREAVVVARDDRGAEPRLMAYLVAAGSPAPSATALRRHLAGICPPYMIPFTFTFLDALPLSENNKVDRKALPGPDGSRPPMESPFLAARDELERQLASLWEQVLDVRPVGVRDDFFELGGDSLLAARLFERIRTSLGGRLPLSTLAEAATVERLAGLLRVPGQAAPTSLVAIQPEGSRPPLFGVHGHTGDVLFYRALSLRLGPDQPLFGLRALAPDGIPAPRSVEDMAARYLDAIRTVQPSGPYHLAGYCFGGLVAFEMARQLRARGEAVALVALLDPDFPGRAPVFPIGYRVSRGRQRIEAQLRELRSLKTARQLRAYVPEKIERLQQVVRSGLDTIRAGALRVLWPRYSGHGRPLPRLLCDPRAINTQAGRLYRPGTFQGRVVLFLSQDTSTGVGPDPRLGWRELASEGARIEAVPGDLTSMLKEPHVDVLAKRLREHLHGIA